MALEMDMNALLRWQTIPPRCDANPGASMSAWDHRNKQDYERGANVKPSICFVAPNAYGLLSGRKDILHIGGAEEQQQAILGRAMAKRGHSVSFVTLDHGQPDGIQHDGITVYVAYAKGAGLPGLRFFYPRWTGLWAAMWRANADVYYKRCADYEVGQAAHWCRWHRRRFIFSAASDTDCLAQLPLLDSARERCLIAGAFGAGRSQGKAPVFCSPTVAERRFAGSQPSV
jgi:hypothetical protein